MAPQGTTTATAWRRRLRAIANPQRAAVLRRFFKTGPGQYGAGDRFLGIDVPTLRRLSREADGMPLEEVTALLQSVVHEERMLALLIWLRQFTRGDEAVQRRIHRAYLAHTRWVNNWDLVDVSAPHLMGGWLVGRPRRVLDRLVRSSSMWERRIAIVATLAFIRAGEFSETLRLADALLEDREDLIHKAVGWMLREVGKRDQPALEAWLRPRCRRLPRTMLRYAIERFPEPLRRRYLDGELA